MGLVGAPPVLDPVLVRRAAGRAPLALVHRGLVVYDDAWVLRPDAALRLPDVVRDGSGFRAEWQLGPGRWSDGAPVAARDALRGLETVHAPEVNAGDEWSTVTLQPEDHKRFVVRWTTGPGGWSAPFPPAPPLLPAHAYPRPVEGRPFHGFGQRPLSNGPYRLLEWVSGTSMRFGVNEHWPGPPPSIKEIRFRLFDRADGLVRALRAGEIDAVGEAAGLTGPHVASLRATLSDHVVHVRPSGLWVHLTVSVDQIPSAVVRRRVHRAVRRDRIAEIAYDGLAEPSLGLFPSRHSAHRVRPAWVGPPAPMAASVRLGLAFATGYPSAERAALLLQEDLEAVGFRIELEPRPLSALLNGMGTEAQSALTLLAFRCDPNWTGREALMTGGPLNYSGISDGELDRRLGAVSESAWTSTARRARLHAVEARFLELAPLIPLVTRAAVSVRPKSLSGWRPTGTITPVTWNAEMWRMSD